MKTSIKNGIELLQSLPLDKFDPKTEYVYFCNVFDREGLAILNSPELFKVLPRERDYKTEHIIFELTEYGQLVALNYLL